MNKKITLFFAFFMISFFVKVQAQAQMYSYPSTEFNETTIAKILDESRKKGVQEWEVEKMRDYLYKRLNNAKNKKHELDTPNPNASQKTFNPNSTLAGCQSCTNVGFEQGNLTGWTLTSGNVSAASLPCNTCATTAGGLATIVNSTSSYNNTTGYVANGAVCTNGTDNCSGQPVLAPVAGNAYSVLLNDNSCGYKMEELSYQLNITNLNNIFTYEYLAVLQDGGHAANAQPYFFSQVLDGSGNVIPCTKVLQSASGTIPGWINSASCASTSYKGWVTVTLDLTSYVGQCLTIQFLVSDCTAGGHFGYCYIDAQCDQEQTNNTVTICPGSTQLCGQAGFSGYTWTGPVTGNTQCLTTSTPGDYTLTATGQCPAPTRYYTVTISPTPTVAFSNTVTPCSYSVPFVDQSTISGGATITNWHWDFGDNTSANSTTAGNTQNHTYATTGTYSVVLTCTSSVGCVASTTVPITLSSGPTATFSATTVCPGVPTAFSTSSVGSYTWNFGEPSSGAANTSNIQNPTHTYATSGSYVATLSVAGTGTCVAVATQTVTVSPIPTATISAPAVCLGAATVFTSTINPTAGSTYNWDYGDGPAALGTATPSHTYGSANTFPVTVTVTAAGGCTVTATTNAVVNALPTAAFSVAQVCQGTGSIFVNTSTNANSCAWNFGGAGNPASATSNCSPTYTYSGSGTFPVTLTITAVGGCSVTTTANAIVDPMPTLTFTANNPCESTSVTFINGTANQASFSNWNWDLGDGTTDATANPPAHPYPAGCYAVVLTATTTTGCTGTYSTMVNVHANPGISFTAFEVCLGDSAEFVDSSYVQAPACSNDHIVSWNWDYGDGTGAHVITNMPDTLKYLYAVCGPKNISYTVTTNYGCTNTVTLTGDTIFCLPIVTAPPSFSACPGVAVANQTFNTTVTNGGPAFSEWFAFSNSTGMPATNVTTGGFDVVPGYNSTTPNLTCNNLIDTVAAIAISSAGCLGNIDFYTVLLYPTPIVNHMDSIKVCANDQVVVPPFTACPATASIAWTNNTPSIGLAANGNGNISSFTGLNTTSQAAYALITSTPSANGCTGPDSTFIIAVSPLPTMTVMTPAPYCPGDNIPSPTINTALGAVLAWTTTNSANIGMATAGAGIPAPYTAPANASLINQVGIVTYTPTLNGCVGTPATETITIKPTPVIQPIANVAYCPGNSAPQINYTCLPTGMGTPNYNWQISIAPFNVGVVPTTASGDSLPAFIAAANNTGMAQMATVTLGASLNNCPSTFSNFNITIYPTPTASFSSIPVCEGQSMNFTDLSIPNSGTISVTTWAWDMNHDGIYNEANTQNPSYSVTPAGIDSVSLFVSTNSVPSCTAVTTQPVIVYPNPVPDFIGDSLSGCPILPVTFRDTSTVALPSTITSYSWSFGNGNSSNLQDPPLQYYNNTTTAVKPYTVSFTVTSTGGCTATKTKTAYINVSPKPIADFDWGPKNADIDDPAITFVNQAIGASPYPPALTYGQYGVHYYLGDTYAYNPSSNYVDNNTSFTHSYDYYQPETYTVTQWVINSLGCKDSIKKEVIIQPNFTFYIPNAFSPNGDGTNEGFKGTGIGIKEGTYNLWVFDRWGNMIFYSDDLEKAWDGHMKGNSDRPLLQEDVYVWKVNFHDFTGKKHDFHGTVTLIK